VSKPQDPERLGAKYWITRYVVFVVVCPALILAFFAVTHWLFGRGDTWYPRMGQGFLGQGLGAATVLLVFDVVGAVRRHRRRDRSIPAAGE
jgi:Na+/glutamate symporter